MHGKKEERREQFEDLGKGHWPRNFSGLGLLRLDRGGGAFVELS